MENCKGDTKVRPVGYTWAYCLGYEEECVSVEFTGSSLSGDKAVLMVDRSWESREISAILRSGESKTYQGKKAKWTVKVTYVAGTGETGSASVDICYEEPEEPCPTPTVSIPSVSNYTPESRDPVDFTSYAYGGTGHTITSRHWDFGDGTTSTEENPSNVWTNTTGADVDYTVTFTATNDCGTSNSTSTVITVSSEPAKTGIEIQFPESMNGKELIAHGAIGTVCGLWWTGPFTHGVLWNKGRCNWADIDSSKKYNILVGDACQEREAIDGIVPEHPTECAGTFENNDYVIILIRNPGFDFRVYSADDIFQLSDSSFNVLYLSATSGDIVDKAFTEWICGLIGIETGSPCDMFWAEFYDPIFVANYMSIQSTGKDVMGNERELGWLDHVAFVASLVGSLPAFNLFPFAGITKAIGKGIKVIIDKALSITDLLSAELQECGRAMADICMNAPQVIRELIPDELTRLREAMVKVFGEIDGNKYVDDALAVTSKLFDEAFAIISKDTVTIQELAKFDTLLTNNAELGGELGAHYKRALLGRPPHPATPTGEDLNAIRNHTRSVHTKDVIDVWDSSGAIDRKSLGSHSRIYQLMDRDYARLKDAFGDNRAVSWVRSQGNIADSVAHAADVSDADTVARSMSDFVWDWDSVQKIMKYSDEQMDEEYDIVSSILESTDVPEWREKATDYVIEKITPCIDEMVPKPAADNAPALFKAWSPQPNALPAAVAPIPKCKPWFSDFSVLADFAMMADDAAQSTMDLVGDDLARAGAALVDVCEGAPEVIRVMEDTQELNIRSALIKIYGDVEGNKYVDDALHAASAFVRKYYDILEDFRTGAAGLPDDAVATILSQGQEIPKDISDLIIEFESAGTIGNLCDELMQAAPEYPLGSAFSTLSTEKSIIDDAVMPGFTKNHCKVAETATAAADPIPTMQISEGTNEIAHKAGDCTGASSAGFTVHTVADDVVEASAKLAAEAEPSKWKLIARDLAGGRFAKVANAIKDMSRREKFMAGWFFWELMSFVVGFMLLKALGIFPGDRSFKAFQRCEAMSTAFFTCKSTCENELWDALKDAIEVYETTIADAEDYLASNSGALGREHSKVTLESAIECAHISIDLWRGCLADQGLNLDAAHTAVVFTSNVICMAYVDGRAIGTVFSGGLLTNIMPGERTLEMRASGYDGCEETVTLVKSGDHAFHCDLVVETCVKPVPTITGPLTGVVKQAVRFTGAATTESEITWWSWDFGNDDDSKDQSASTMYWDAGTYTVQLTVTDDCGTATAEHTIIISAEGEIPDPTPTEEAGTLLVKKPLNAENNIECNRAWDAEIFVDGVKMSGSPPLTIQFGTNKYVGSYGGQCGTHKIKVRLADYQDVEEPWTINDGDDKTWTPKMYLDDYVPPAGTHQIDFYIPEGATLNRPTKITGLSRLTTGIRRIRDNG